MLTPHWRAICWSFALLFAFYTLELSFTVSRDAGISCKLWAWIIKRLMILAEAKHLLKVANLKANVGIENGW